MILEATQSVDKEINPWLSAAARFDEALERLPANLVSWIQTRKECYEHRSSLLVHFSPTRNLRLGSQGRIASSGLPMRLQTCLYTALLACLPQAVKAQTVDPLYAQSYSITNLGSVTGVPPVYGGMVFKDANTLWIGGAAITASGRYYSVAVTRGAGNHIVSLGAGTILGFGTFNDGGIAFGPGGVLFYTEYPGNNMGEVLPPGYSSDYKTIGLTALGVAPSVGAANFVPAGYNGAGQFKVVSHDTAGFYTMPLTPDGSGGYNLGRATLETTLCGGNCGPEGFVYAPLGSPRFPSQSMLVTEYYTNSVGSYTIDGNGNPVPSSRQNFITGLNGAQCAALDPVTGDVLFATFGAGNQVIEVRGFAATSSAPGTPTITNVSDQAAGTTNLTPGMPIQVVGTGFGTSASDSAAVTIGSEAAPVLTFVNSTNLLVQIPVDAPPGPTTLTVTYKSQASAAFKIVIVALAPEIEPFQSQGGSSFYDVNGNPITTAHPAIPNAGVYCLAIGLGTTTPPQATGKSATAPAPTTQAVQVMVGNKMAQPTYAGLFVGGKPGFYQVSFTVPADAPMGNQRVTLSVGGQTSNAQTLIVAPPVPVINAIVNGATFNAGASAANSFVSLFGLNFGTQDTQSNIFPATSFNGLSVLVNGTAVPLYFVVGSSGQINIVLPSELGRSGNATVEVMTAEGKSTAFQLALAPDSVGVFRIADPYNPKRMNGAVLFSNTAWTVMPLSMATALGFPSCASVTTASVCGKPAKVGDQIQIYLTGLGKATPNGDPNGAVLPTGSLAPADGSVLYETVEKPAVKIGGVPAIVEFAGIAPGNAGEYQINVAVPSGVQPGDDVTLEVAMPDGSKDTVTIAITN